MNADLDESTKRTFDLFTNPAPAEQIDLFRNSPPPEIAQIREATYEHLRSTPSDINEHLDLLRALASKCSHVTEFGMRWGNGSTVAFLAAQPKELISWDIDPYSIVSQQTANLLAIRGRTSFQPRVGDTLVIPQIEPTDLLFIDTLHTWRQLKAELVRHADPVALNVRKYLVFHDSSTYGMKGEDGSEPGLIAVIRWFQKDHAFPLWGLKHHLKNNNGLVVLERIDVEATPGVFP